MTTGEKLKSDLGLTKFNKVKITRSLDSSIPVYMVIVDSKGFPITNNRVWRDKGKFALYTGNKLPQKSSFTPLMDLDQFNPSNLNGRIFIRIDLAGSNLVNKKMYEGKTVFTEDSYYIYGNIYNLLEGSGFNIKDLTKNAVSPITKKSGKERQTDGQSGNTLESVIWDETEDSLLLQFFVLPTFEQSINITDLQGNIKKSNSYEVEILFEEISKILGSKEEFLKLSPGDRIKKVRELIKKGEVRIHANDLSWWFQGGFENADKLNYEIYDFPGPGGKGVWSKRHKGESPAIYITKHMNEVLRSIPFITDEITKMIK